MFENKSSVYAGYRVFRLDVTAMKYNHAVMTQNYESGCRNISAPTAGCVARACLALGRGQALRAAGLVTRVGPTATCFPPPAPGPRPPAGLQRPSVSSPRVTRTRARLERGPLRIKRVGLQGASGDFSLHSGLCALDTEGVPGASEKDKRSPTEWEVSCRSSRCPCISAW